MSQEAPTFVTPDGTVLTQLPNGEWQAVLHDGFLTVNLGEIDPSSMEEYDTLALKSLTSKQGLNEIIDTKTRGAQVRLRDNWFAWGDTEKTHEGNIIFCLRHLTI